MSRSCNESMQRQVTLNADAESTSLIVQNGFPQAIGCQDAVFVEHGKNKDVSTHVESQCVCCAMKPSTPLCECET